MNNQQILDDLKKIAQSELRNYIKDCAILDNFEKLEMIINLLGTNRIEQILLNDVDLLVEIIKIKKYEIFKFLALNCLSCNLSSQEVIRRSLLHTYPNEQINNTLIFSNYKHEIVNSINFGDSKKFSSLISGDSFLKYPYQQQLIEQIVNKIFMTEIDKLCFIKTILNKKHNAINKVKTLQLIFNMASFLNEESIINYLIFDLDIQKNLVIDLISSIDSSSEDINRRFEKRDLMKSLKIDLETSEKESSGKTKI